LLAQTELLQRKVTLTKLLPATGLNYMRVLLRSSASSQWLSAS